MEQPRDPRRALVLAIQILYVVGIFWMGWKSIPEHRRQLLRMRLEAWARPRLRSVAQTAGRAGMKHELADDGETAAQFYQAAYRIMKRLERQ